jgi:hypothetical protein
VFNKGLNPNQPTVYQRLASSWSMVVVEIQFVQAVSEEAE